MSYADRTRRVTARRLRAPIEASTRAGHDRWLVSYADFITLLFAFFTMMYAVSTVDAERLRTMTNGLKLVFSESPPPLPFAENVLRRGRDAERTAPPPSIERIRERLSGSLGARVAQERIELTMERRGLVVSIREDSSFATGSADLSVAARDVFHEIALTLADVDNPLRIEGHTDDMPIKTSRFVSNWDLSARRATTVVEFLANQGGISPLRLSAAGYAHFRPRVPNDTEANRARNRRVDLVILSDATRQAEEASTGRSR